MNLIEVHDLNLSYQMETQRIDVLRGLNFTVSRGEYLAIQGPSGSGKSTLFYVLGCLLKKYQGEVKIEGQDIAHLNSQELALLRNQKIGFIFQQFHLLPRTSVLNNILLPSLYPLELKPMKDHQPQVKAGILAERMGLTQHLNHRPNQLSGGQQQKTAIARALLNDPEIILADEPTGNLDSRSSQEILALLDDLHQQGKTIIVITHDPEVAQRAQKIYHMRDGQLTHIESEREPAHNSVLNFHPEINYILETKTDSVTNYCKRLLPIITENLFRNRTKSLLTMMGVVIGIAAVLAMVTLGEYVEKKVLAGYDYLGVNQISFTGYFNWYNKQVDRYALKFNYFNWDKDVVPLLRIFPEIRRITPMYYAWNATISSRGLTVAKPIKPLGVSTEYFGLSNKKLLIGEFFSPIHEEQRSPVCVIGYQIAKELFANSDPRGQFIRITIRDRENYTCQVIGALAPQASNNEQWKPDYQVFMPHTFFKTVHSYWDSLLDELIIQFHEGTDVEASGKKILTFFKQKYGNTGMFNVGSNSVLVSQMRRFINIFNLLLGCIAALSLLVGGIGIYNMILASITDRLREFGLRKALGATDQSIRTQVLGESILLCSLAGLIGLIIGFSTYELLILLATKLVQQTKFEWLISPWALTLSLLAILTVGILSGLQPAIKAEKLEVIEALRAE